MPAKRVSVSSSARPTKFARRVVEPWQPALDLVEKSSKSLPKSCVSMLKAAMPHLFTVPREGRHSYHESIIEALIKLGEEEHERRRAAMAVAEGNLQAFKAEESDFAANYEKLQADVAAKVAEKDTAEDESNKKQKVAAAAAKAKQEQEDKVLAAEMEVKAASAKKVAYEESMSQWEALKTYAFPKKEWRARNKTASVILGCLKEASAPQSLQASLSAALSGGPECSPFASVAIEHSEKAMTDHIAKMVTEIENLEGVLSEHKQAVEAVERDAQAAQQEADAAMQASIDTANTWVEAASKVTELERTKAGFADREGQLILELGRKKDSLEAFALIREQVQALVDGTSSMEDVAVEEEKGGDAEMAQSVLTPLPEVAPVACA